MAFFYHYLFVIYGMQSGRVISGMPLVSDHTLLYCYGVLLASLIDISRSWMCNTTFPSTLSSWGLHMVLTDAVVWRGDFSQ